MNLYWMGRISWPLIDTAYVAMNMIEGFMRSNALRVEKMTE